jgi:hypothetical protein
MCPILRASYKYSTVLMTIAQNHGLKINLLMTARNQYLEEDIPIAYNKTERAIAQWNSQARASSA